MNDTESSAGFPKIQNIPEKAKSGKEKNARAFPISQINYMLYLQLSERFGIGEEEKDQDHNHLILVRHLNPDDPLTGFQGKIRFVAEKFQGHTTFELYAHIHHDDPELEMIGGPVRGGMWAAHGQGDLMVEKLRAGFQIGRGLDFESPTTTLIGRIIEAAGALAKDPNCSCDRFWTGERFR
ncbi:MAG: hypothetical protein A3J76_03010 [Candidatus Moranbacteria bacterium RBG_13_45_13]|nr:MAG: hypothetical protein A3J76_03010 [Candidatus Moranbacteria bacterium RBG_13_45_13]